jgi:hypothetical protein
MRPLTAPTVLFALALSGCGTAADTYDSGYAPEPAGYAQGNDFPAAAESAERSAPRPQPMSDRSESKRAQSRPSPAPSKSSGATAGQPQQPSGQAGQAVQAEPEVSEPRVIYMGYLKLRVKRVIEAADEVTRLAKEAGGYIQAMGATTIIVRVPAVDFDASMEKFGTVGEQLDRRVKALDVSRQFTDLDARLSVAVESRDRLLALLKTVRDVEERLQILEEVKRLSEIIDGIESSLATLRNLTAYFTITIDLEPLVQNTAIVQHRSPFAWIRELQPHLVTLHDGKDAFTLDLPKGFVLFEDDDDFRAQAADTSMLRAAIVENEPRGDGAFWSNAVHFELDGRDEELVDQAVLGTLHVRVYRDKDVRPRYWLVGVVAVGDKLGVVEVFYPNEDAYRLHHEAMRNALQTLKVAP